MTEKEAAQDARLMSWENFRASFLEDGIAAEVPVVGEPAVTVFAQPHSSAIGLRTPATPGIPAPVSDVDAISVDVADGLLRIRVHDSRLFQQFFAFLLDVSNRIQLDGQHAEDAFTAALASWRQMLSAVRTMPDEVQLGLAGELWTLIRLSKRLGPKAAEAWTGADREAHDFRLDSLEIEVKTTVSDHRWHHINRLDQLVPSPEMDLYVLSLQMISAGVGPGFALADQIAAARSVVASDGAIADAFERKLGKYGWRDADAQHYPRRRRIGSPAILVAADDQCPKIAPNALAELLGGLASRVDEVRYRVNLTGLGITDGEPDFLKIMPD